MRPSLVFSLLIALGMSSSAGAQDDPLQKVGQILVVIEENHSFDNIFGLFPGANGIFNAGETAIQVDEHDKPFETLPHAIDTREKSPDNTPRRGPPISPDHGQRAIPDRPLRFTRGLYR